MPDPNPAPAPAPAPAPDPNPAPAPAPAAEWHGIPATDAEGTAYIKNKGWTGPADVIKSYQGAEKLIGRDPNTLLAIPRADDPAGLRTALGKLGLPESADKYELPKPPEGLALDASYEKFARTAFHKAGLTASMAKTLTEEHHAYVTAVAAQQEKDYALSVAADKTALLNEWKGGHERMKNAAETAAKTLGFSPEMIDGIERSVGYAGTWKFLADLGKRMGEDGLVLGGDKGGDFTGTLTPAEAKAEWEKVKLDPNMMAALKDKNHPAHKSTKEKQTALFKVMYPAG
jgi:hypothetical protein